MVLEHRVDVRHLEGDVIEARPLVHHAEERVVVDVLVAAVAPVERADDVVLVARVHVVRAEEAERLPEPLDRLPHLRRAEHAMPDALDRRRRFPEAHQHAGSTQRLGARVHRLFRDGDGRQRLDAVHDLDPVAVRLREPDALAAAGLVDALHGGRPRRLRHPLEVVLAAGAVRERQESGLPLLRHVEMVSGVRAAHVERARRPRRPDQAEVSEELLHDVQVGRPEPDIREILHLDRWHRRLPCSGSLVSRGAIAVSGVILPRLGSHPVLPGGCARVENGEPPG